MQTTQSIEERTHLDGVTTIRPGDRRVGRRGVAVLIHPLSVHTHALHRDGLVVLRVRINGHVAIAGIQHEALDGLSVALRSPGLDGTVLRPTRLEGVARLANRGLVDPVSVEARVLHAIVVGVSLASFVLRGRECGGSRARRRHRLRQRRNKSKRQRGCGNGSAATARVVVFLQNGPFNEVSMRLCS